MPIVQCCMGSRDTNKGGTEIDFFCLEVRPEGACVLGVDLEVEFGIVPSAFTPYFDTSKKDFTVDAFPGVGKFARIFGGVHNTDDSI